MPENEIEQPQDEPVEEPRRKRKHVRNIALFGGASAILLALAIGVLVFLYWFGTFDRFVRNQFTATMYDIGVVFDAEVFRLTVSPLELRIRNATFSDRVTGEKLFFIKDATIGLSVRKVLAWKLSADIAVDSTDIDGLEMWITFDENGKSNYQNITFVEQEGGAINLRYDTVTFKLRNGTVHAGQVSRSISGDANNVSLAFAPEDVTAEKLRYTVYLTSTDSRFVWNEAPLQPIDITAKAVVYEEGAEIQEINVETPIGDIAMNGTVSDWSPFSYKLNVESTIDLTQTASTFPLETAVSGTANFKGTVAGDGESYVVEGAADSQALGVDNVYLKAVNVEGTVAGTNVNYEANGTAVAELLTFDDFRIEFPRLVGNIRGTGTDFRWVGELQAAAVKSGSLTIGGLFLSDAVAELNDGDISVYSPNARTQKFSVGDLEFNALAVRNLRFAANGGPPTLSGTSATATSMVTPDYRIDSLTSGELAVKLADNNTTVNIQNLNAQSAQVGSNRIRDIRSGSFTMSDRPEGTDLTFGNVSAAEVNADGATISGVESPSIEIQDRPAETKIYSDNLRVASIVTGGAQLGSLNIGGVRLSIREGRIEGTSNDIDAGTITLLRTETLPDGGRLDSVRLVTPVFVVEPSGRYRASADMSIGGGIVGTIPLGAVSASVNIDNDRVELNELNGEIMNGNVSGNVTVAFNNSTQSRVAVDFANLDLESLLSLQSGTVMPIEGKTTGRVDITFPGTDMVSMSGTVDADILADAGSVDQGSIPVTGKIELTATNGLFNIDTAKLNSPKSTLSASGQFDLRASDTDLGLVLASTDATEIDRILRSMEIAPEAIKMLDSMQISFAGNLGFKGDLTGSFSDPTLEGQVALQTFVLRGKPIGSVTTAVYVSPDGVRLTDGRLDELGSGFATFEIEAPSGGTDNTTVQAKLVSIDASDLLAVLPVHFLDRFGSVTGKTTGSVDLTGLPGHAEGSINFITANGTIGSQSFQNLIVKADFDATGKLTVDGAISSGGGTFRINGTYDMNTTAADIGFVSDDMPLQLVLAILPPFGGVSSVAGLVDLKGRMTGEFNDISTYTINFEGAATGVVINEEAFGTVTLNGKTIDQVLTAEMVAMLEGKPQPINATLNFGDPNLPFRVESIFVQSPLGPFFALVPQLSDIDINGNGTGKIQFGGNLSHIDQNGVRVYSSENLTGDARFTSLTLNVEGTPLEATEPVVVLFDPNEVTFKSAKFAGGGSNVSIAGTVAISDTGESDLNIVGRVNLALLNAFGPIKEADAFFGGYANVAIHLTGTSGDSNLSGTANLDDATIATFVGAERLTFQRINGRILFTSNQAQIENLTGYLGNGKFTVSGGVLFADDLEVEAYRLSFVGNDVTVPYPNDFITIGDIAVEVTGKRIDGEMKTLITGNIRAGRSVYSRDIDLARIVGARGNGALSTGSSASSSVILDITIEGNNALVVQNNVADLTASFSLRITGSAADPQITGRIVADGGQLFFRNDRYDIQRAVIVFPPGPNAQPTVSLQAETEIAGYQIFVNISGPLTDAEQLNATVRSSPPLPQSDVISLMTTGSLSNTGAGIPTLAQTGLNTAAGSLVDSIINNPVRKATDRLFGLNVFEIDPIIAGNRLNPSARLTVGRQINNNLRITYSTNLSQDQNQVIAVEYRISNTFSFIAMYEQRSLTNVTHSRNNFSFGVRFRRRF